MVTGTYIPRKEIEIVRTVSATVIKPNQAVKLRARKEFVDKEGNQRVTGEEWMVKKSGAYLPGAYEDVVDIVEAFVLTDKVRISYYINNSQMRGKSVIYFPEIRSVSRDCVALLRRLSSQTRLEFHIHTCKP